MDLNEMVNSKQVATGLNKETNHESIAFHKSTWNRISIVNTNSTDSRVDQTNANQPGGSFT